MWTEIIASLAAVAASVFAWLSWKRAGDALARADEQTTVARDANVVARQANAMSSEANRTTVEANKVTVAALAASEEHQRLIDARETEYHRVKWGLGWSMPFPTTKDEVIDTVLHIGNHSVDDAFDVRITLAIDERFSKVTGLGKIDGHRGGRLVPIQSTKGDVTHLEHEDWMRSQASLFLNNPCDVLIEWRTEAGARRSEEQYLSSLLDYPEAVRLMTDER